MSIYVPFAKPKTVKEFLLKFFKSDGILNSPEPGTRRGSAVPTYREEGCTPTKLQCRVGCNRSIQDLFECVTTYFPEVTLPQLMKELVKLRIPQMCLYPSYCYDIQRAVMSFSPFPRRDLPQNGSALYSWGRLLREADIKKMSDLYD